MKTVYQTEGTCCKQIELEVDGDVVKSVRFLGGCHGNLQGIARLVEGMPVADVVSRLSGIRCGMKPTSLSGSTNVGSAAGCFPVLMA